MFTVCVSDPRAFFFSKMTVGVVVSVNVSGCLSVHVAQRWTNELSPVTPPVDRQVGVDPPTVVPDGIYKCVLFTEAHGA